MKNLSKKISTKALPGFMELLPEDQIVFNRMKTVIRDSYESFGFIPMDTPLIERSEVLLAKAGGETEKQIYRFKKGDNDISLRFDLTVPLSRYVSEHLNDLTFPFKRYQIDKVYRGEKPQKGRYREFYQCDIDIIGREKLSFVNDAEILAVIYEVFSNLDLPPVLIRISNRKLITGLMNSLSLAKKSVEVMRIIDKAEKISLADFKKSLTSLKLDKKSIDLIVKFIGIKGSVAEVIKELSLLNIDNDIFNQGLAELKAVISNVKSFSLPAKAYTIDLAIARGLDYYTSTVYETNLKDYPQIGSICSGGRYDDLSDNYSSQKLPGVGISIGLTRLFSQLKELGLIKKTGVSPVSVLIIPFDEKFVPRAIEVSRELRVGGIKNEVYFESAKFKDKLSYANKLKINRVIIIGEDELAGNFLSLKDMDSGGQKKIKSKELIKSLTA